MNSKATIYPNGKISCDEKTIPMDTMGEISYIPVDLARKRLERVVNDMETLRNEHTIKLNKIMERYQEIETKTKLHYEIFVNELKRRTLERIKIHKLQYASLQHESKISNEQAKLQIESLQETISNHEIEYTKQYHIWETERIQTITQHNETIESLHQVFETELARLLNHGKLQQEKAEERVACCFLELHDKRWETPELKSTACQVEDLSPQMTDIVNQNESLSMTQAIEPNNSVDSIPIDQSESTCTPNSHDEYVKLDPVIAGESGLVPAVPGESGLVAAVSGEDQLHAELQRAQDDAAMIRALYNELVIGCDVRNVIYDMITQVELVSIVSSPSPMVDLKKKNSTIVVTNTTEDSIPKEKSIPLSIVSKWKSKIGLEPPKEYETLLTCEIELDRLKTTLDHLKTTHTTTYHEKAQAKQYIKEWLVDFQMKNNREPTLNDKAQVKELYVAFKNAEEKYNEIKQELITTKELYQNKLKQVETLQQSENMIQFPHHTLVAHLRTALDEAQNKIEIMYRNQLKTPPNNIQKKPSIEELKKNLQRQPSISGPTCVGNIIQQDKMIENEIKNTKEIEIQREICKNEIKTIEIPNELNQENEIKNIEKLNELNQEILNLKNNIHKEKIKWEILYENQLASCEELYSWRIHYSILIKNLECTISNNDITTEEDDEMTEELTDMASISTHSDGKLTIRDLVEKSKQAIDAGKAAWNQGDKTSCHVILLDACQYVASSQVKSDAVDGVIAAMTEAESLIPAKAAVVLRKALDTLVTVPEIIQSKGEKIIAGDEKNSIQLTTKKMNEYKQKLKVIESKWKTDRIKLNQYEQIINKTTNETGNISKQDIGNERIYTKKIADVEKKAQKIFDEAQNQAMKQINSLKNELEQLKNTTNQMKNQIQQDKITIETFQSQMIQKNQIENEIIQLKQDAILATTIKENLNDLKIQYNQLENQYKEEQILRKKYYNTIEDMKGKIRVYCRCRPMSSNELNQGFHSCLRFIDDYTLEIDTNRGPRTFTYDAVFNPSHSQEQIFEDTKHLLQSALDGYNVCIFAYGQTGSGKTFTMTGTNTNPGITKRLIDLMFELKKNQVNQEIIYEASMLELYNDQLIDLLAQLEPNYKEDKVSKLDIKKNEKGMVIVTNSILKQCINSEETLELYDAANKKRQVGATKMNAESSRSHSIFTIFIQNYNKTTKQTSIGKLSLVDLAGSERAGKTGATAERLKEAQAINKSLSALGDVISALSTNEKFIPYRNNKLTQLMQDSLGGNAKTLMFVNISPANYNQEETQTSLSYASRVKLITNQANKNSDNEEIVKLKQIIKQLKAGIDIDSIGE